MTVSQQSHYRRAQRMARRIHQRVNRLEVWSPVAADQQPWIWLYCEGREFVVKDARYALRDAALFARTCARLMRRLKPTSERLALAEELDRDAQRLEAA